jgi:hypothetical protein
MSRRAPGGHETVNILPLQLSLAYPLSSPPAAQTFLAPKLGFSTTC